LIRPRQAIQRILDRRYSTRRELVELQVEVDFLTSLTSGMARVDSKVDFLRKRLAVRPNAHTLQRIGALHDGGYFLPVDLLADRVVISLGVGNEVSADRELADMGHTVFQYDPTITASPLSHPRVEWFPIGVSGRPAGPLADCVPLSEICARHSIARESEAILMMDVEGAEWNVLVEDASALQNFAVAVVELHGIEMVFNETWSGVIMSAIENLTRNHVPVALLANNCAPVLTAGGYLVPCVIEVTLVHATVFKSGAATSPLLAGSVPQNDPHRPPIEPGDIFALVGLSPSRYAPSLDPTVLRG
jgi:hypothetical protein